MRLFGLIGHPLSHSFSKKYFSEKFEQENLTNCEYELFPIASINELLPLILSYPLLEGLNITIPYKKKILPFLDTSFIPDGLAACNCVRVHEGKLIGFNTDAIGFEKSLLPLLQSHHTKALVLGNGGAAEAVIFVLTKLGIEFKMVSRKLHSGSTLMYNNLNGDIINESSIIINTTPVGMYPNMDDSPEIPYQFISNQHLLYDLVYNPSKTLFLKKGEEKGAAIKNGEEMLVLQAEESWRIWNQ